jgi:Arc/MetJ family transcription regulator
MKRITLTLDEELLRKASRLLGEETYSATVSKALEEAVKTTSLRNLLNFQGSDI